MNIRGLGGIAKRSVGGWMDDGAASMGAALAFYTMLSMGPLLVLVITIAGMVVGREAAQVALMSEISGLLGDTGTEAIKSLLDAASTENGGLIATLVSAFTLLLGATTVFAELQTDLDRIWKVTKQKSTGILGFLRTRLFSFGLVVAIGFLLLVSLVASAAVSFVGQSFFGGTQVLMRVLELAVSVGVLTVLFAMVYKILPSRRIAWSDVWVGSAVTAVLFTIGKFLIGLYLGKSAVASDFGAAGTLVVVIFWVYYSAQIFFLGAEFTREYSLSRGSKSGAGPEAANSDFIGGDADMVARARKIVKGRDPILSPEGGRDGG